jgi:Uncharacterized protein containing a Zn-ribbon (DUF2116)
VSLVVRVVRSFEAGDAVETLARVVDFPIAPALGMAVTFADGAQAVIGRVGVRLHDWAPGVSAAAVEVQTIPEPAAESARAPVVAGTVESTERRCPGCGRPVTVRQRACSAKCRAALSRRRQDEAR